MSITGHRTRPVFNRHNITSEADKRAALLKAEEFTSRTEAASNVAPIR